MDMGCHVLDRIDYLFGPIINVRVRYCKRVVMVVVMMKKGGTIHWWRIMYQ